MLLNTIGINHDLVLPPIYDAVFLDNLCLQLYFSQKQTSRPILRNISDIVAILPLQYCKSFLASAFTLEGKLKKKYTVKLVTTNKTFVGMLDICMVYARP